MLGAVIEDAYRACSGSIREIYLILQSSQQKINAFGRTLAADDVSHDPELYFVKTPDQQIQIDGCYNISSRVVVRIQGIHNAHQHLKHNHFLKDNCCIIQINNNDNLCFARAFTIATMPYNTYSGIWEYFERQDDDYAICMLIKPMRVTKLAVNDPRSRAIDKLVVEMIALDDQPFSMVGTSRFTHLMKLVHIILCDSAANIKKAIKDLKFESGSCTPHKLNLVVNDGNIIEAMGIKKLDNKKWTNKKPIESRKQNCLKFNDNLAAISSSEGSAEEDIDENSVRKLCLNCIWNYPDPDRDPVWHNDNVEQNPDGGLFTKYFKTFIKMKLQTNKEPLRLRVEVQILPPLDFNSSNSTFSLALSILRALQALFLIWAAFSTKRLFKVVEVIWKLQILQTAAEEEVDQCAKFLKQEYGTEMHGKSLREAKRDH
uniref:Uncharacterized protein n=1 Tax=Romanomermis culicivorax TaxID=13658 RepID=A0A915IVT7_ROMCU